MNGILIDSSAWIEYFKVHKEFLFIDNLIDNNKVCINDLILAELLPSIIHRKEKHLAELLNNITKYEIEVDWDELQKFQVLNLRHGNNNIGIADLIIIQNCIQNKLKLVTRDKHFSLMSKYLPLEIYESNT
jgi:predicted nucleic acid-binding protein